MLFSEDPPYMRGWNSSNSVSLTWTTECGPSSSQQAGLPDLLCLSKQIASKETALTQIGRLPGQIGCPDESSRGD